MKQTGYFGLNLPEIGGVLSILSLNENAEKIDRLLTDGVVYQWIAFGTAK